MAQILRVLKTASRRFISPQTDCKTSMQTKMKLLGLILASFFIIQIFAKSFQAVDPCDSAKCQLPDCLCASTKIPGGLSPEQTPQIITISYDDALRDQDYVTYYSKVFAERQYRLHFSSPTTILTMRWWRISITTPATRWLIIAWTTANPLPGGRTLHWTNGRRRSWTRGTSW